MDVSGDNRIFPSIYETVKFREIFVSHKNVIRNVVITLNMRLEN